MICAHCEQIIRPGVDGCILIQGIPYCSTYCYKASLTSTLSSDSLQDEIDKLCNEVNNP